MAAYNRNRYQYETSPRKLEPEYRPTSKTYPKKSTAKKKVSSKNKHNKKQKTNVKISSKAKAIVCVGIVFAVLFAISYRNTVISEKYSQIKKLKNDLSVIEKENEQLEVNIESKTNLGNIEKEAKEKLGMKKIGDKQTVYVELNKQDYIESPSENITLNENKNIFQKIIEKVKTLF